MPTFHVVHHETNRPAHLFAVGHKKPLQFNITGQSILKPRQATKAQYQMKVSDRSFFAGLVTDARQNGSAPLTLQYDDGSTVNLTVSERSGKLFLENHDHSFAVLTGQNGTEESPGDVQAMALDPVSALVIVAVVAIIAIAAIAITDNGGSVSGTASSGDQSASFEADGGRKGD